MNNNIDNYFENQSVNDPKIKKLISEEKMASEAAIKVYELRKELGLTQREFGKLVGKPQSTIARIESAEMYPSIKLLAEIAMQTNKDLTIKFE